MSWGMFSTVGCHDKCGGYLEYCGEVFNTVEDIMSTVGDVISTMGGHHKYHGVS